MVLERAETHDHNQVEEIKVREPGDDFEEHITAEGFERGWGVVGGGHGPDMVGLIVGLGGCMIYLYLYPHRGVNSQLGGVTSPNCHASKHWPSCPRVTELELHI